MDKAYFPIIFDLGIKQPDIPEDEPKALACLTARDWEMLAEKSRLMTFSNNDVILEKGLPPQAIYIIEKGKVRIERAKGDVIARRGQGAVFGEMSFVEGKETSATVVADEKVEVSVIDNVHVEALLEADKEFAIRFYKTLAFTMAYRLRQAAERLSQLS